MSHPILDNAHCLHCGYLLRGLSGTICPECGTAFDPHDEATFSTGMISVGKTHRLIALLALGVMFISPFFSVIGRVPGKMTPGMVIYLSLLIAGYGTQIGIVITSAVRLFRYRGKNMRKRRLVAALVISLFVVIGCPSLPLMLLLFGIDGV